MGYLSLLSSAISKLQNALVHYSGGFDSVTIWLDLSLNIWPFTIMNIYFKKIAKVGTQFFQMKNKPKKRPWKAHFKNYCRIFYSAAVYFRIKVTPAVWQTYLVPT